MTCIPNAVSPEAHREALIGCIASYLPKGTELNGIYALPTSELLALLDVLRAKTAKFRTAQQEAEGKAHETAAAEVGAFLTRRGGQTAASLEAEAASEV